MEIKRAQYKDIGCLEVRTQKWTALFSAEYGGKMLSLVCNRTGRQVLEERADARYRTPVYDGIYIDAECSAFDDMFPTIDRMRCDQYPWEGAVYPDHGEVYALPWQHETEDGALHMWVHSIRFGYRLDKWVREEGGAIRLDYSVRNLTPFPLDFIYAAHCMLKAEEGARLEVPFADGASCTTIFSDMPELGGYGAKAAWPVHKGLDLSRTHPKSEGAGFKVYFDQCAGNLCTYRYPDGDGLNVSFSNETLPYFAVWANFGGFKDMYNVAIEPCSGAFDRPDIAKKHGQNSVLQGNAEYAWWIKFDICQKGN